MPPASGHASCSATRSPTMMNDISLDCVRHSHMNLSPAPRIRVTLNWASVLNSRVNVLSKSGRKHNNAIIARNIDGDFPLRTGNFCSPARFLSGRLAAKKGFCFARNKVTEEEEDDPKSGDLGSKKVQQSMKITTMLFTVLTGALLSVDSIILLKLCPPLIEVFQSYYLKVPIMVASTFTFPFLVSAAVSGLLGCIFVPLLRKLKANQIFRMEGPAAHFSKVGTPTMGGLFFIPVGIGVAGFVTRFASTEFYGLSTATLAFGAIGLLDDGLVLMRNHNYGLPGWCKLSLQVAVGIWFYFWLDSASLLSPFQVKTMVLLPPPFNHWNLGNWYLPLTAFCFAAMSNGVNLTDGLDGLAGGTAAAAFVGMAFAVLRVYPAVGVFGASMAGACVGFLVHNHHRAAVFMGDTGSLALGGALAAMAACTGTFLPLFIISAIFFVETVSVIVQVFYFKLTKRIYGVGQRLFRMAPLHHHVELVGVKEPAIVAGAYLISCVMAFLGGYLGFVISGIAAVGN